MADALLDPPDCDEDGCSYVEPSRFPVLASRVVPAVASEPAVPGCDCELTAAEHADGIGDVAQCSCYMARVAARANRKVA